MALSPQDRARLDQQDAHFLALPLSLGPQPHSMAAHVRKMVALLRDPKAASPSSNAIAHLTVLYERTVPPRTDIACRKGCGYCCTQPVIVSAPEAFFVAAQLRESPDRTQAIADAAKILAGLPPDRAWHDWVRCPLLEDESCSIYAARPLACHSFVSVNLAACIAAFVDHGPPDIPMPADNVSLLYGCRILLCAAQRLIGVTSHSYEMNKAVAAILAQGDDAEARWLAGEDVLSGLQDPTPIPPQFERQIAGMAGFVAPTI